MSRDIDKLILDTDKEIEKLKIFKAKQEELKQLQTESSIADEKQPIKTKAKKQKKVKKHITLPKITISSRIRKLTVSVIVFSVVIAGLLFINPVRAADPAINFADPDDGGTFADTNDGDGVNWVVNVTDADTNLAWVKLYSNDSGAWVEFYDSGALGGVAYHNASGTNGNWTGSWTTYWYNISADDGTTHDTTYSFTTAYQWGYPEMAKFGGDISSYSMGGMPYKNNTGEYYLSLHNDTGNDTEVKQSATGTNWGLMDHSKVDASVQDDPNMGVWDFFTYNNEPAFFYVEDGDLGYVTVAHTSDGGSSWTLTSTGILGRGWKGLGTHARYGIGTAIKYYDGYWQLVAGRGGGSNNNDWHLTHYRGTPWNTWSLLSNIETGTSISNADMGTSFTPSLALFDGVLHLTYKDMGNDLHWKTYNGVSWTDKGDIEADIGYGCSMVKDYVNDQLVLVYSDGSNDLKYRVNADGTSWSDACTINTDLSFYYPHVNYIDARLVIGVSWNKRGTWNVYTISAPGYVERTSGLNVSYNRIQFPDANPDGTNINSTVFSLKNINNRDIVTIMWHFEDIGDIANASNFKVWTNMSGAWTSIGTTGADGDVATLDISGLMAGGGEWIPGQSTWWKVEILDIGSVSESVHTTDEDIWYMVTFA